MALAQRPAINLRIIDGGPGSLDLEGLVPSIAAGDEPAVRTGLHYGVSHLYNLFKNQGFLSEA